MDDGLENENEYEYEYDFFDPPDERER